MRCSACGATMRVGDWPYCPHGSTMSTRAQGFSPVVVFKDRKTGEYVFPGSTTERAPKGCERVELRTVHEVRKFEREVNHIESAKRYDQRARHQDHQDHLNRVRTGARDVLLSRLPTMSPAGRAFAMEAIRRNDERRAARPSFSSDPKFRISAFSDSASSGWKGKRVL